MDGASDLCTDGGDDPSASGDSSDEAAAVPEDYGLSDAERQLLLPILLKLSTADQQQLLRAVTHPSFGPSSLRWRSDATELAAYLD